MLYFVSNFAIQAIHKIKALSGLDLVAHINSVRKYDNKYATIISRI
jgi:hypothetical protein